MPFHDDTFERVAASIPDLRGSELERLLASATHVARNAICITDAQLDAPGPRIVYVNPAFERMTGYRADEVLGRDPRFLQGPGTDRRVLDRLRGDLEAGRPFQGETTNYRKDGTPFTMAWRIAAIRDDQGRTTHYVAAQDDLSALRAAEGALRSLSTALQGALLSTPPEVDGLAVAWRYRPAAGHALVGGDWCDAGALPGGGVAAFLGDVAGHDDQATALMGECRFLCRGLVRVVDDPGALLGELEAALLQDRSPGQVLASVVAAVATPDGLVRYSVAGHPAPAVRRAGGGVEVLEGGRSPMVGVSRGGGARPTATVQLGVGDTFVTF
ncbi:MAG: SpoIIE family protein phosphatase [Acidimicrobiales bacterium]